MHMSSEAVSACHALLGVTFLLAGFGKLRHHGLFAEQLLTPILSAVIPATRVGPSAHIVSVGFGVVEIAVGAGIGLSRSAIPLLLGLSLLAVGLAWYSLMMMLRPTNECGCFLRRPAVARDLRSLEGYGFLVPVLVSVRNGALSFLLLTLLGVTGNGIAVFLAASYACVAAGLSVGVMQARSKLGAESLELESILAPRMESVVIVEWAQKECLEGSRV